MKTPKYSYEQKSPNFIFVSITEIADFL